MTALLPAPRDIRKASAFVEALAEVEERFGVVVDFGTIEDAKSDFGDPVTFSLGEEGDRYAIVRSDGTGEPGHLRLALVQ